MEINTVISTIVHVGYERSLHEIKSIILEKAEEKAKSIGLNYSDWELIEGYPSPCTWIPYNSLVGGKTVMLHCYHMVKSIKCSLKETKNENKTYIEFKYPKRRG